MIYLKTFKLSDSRITNNNIYPSNECITEFICVTKI